MGGREPCPGCGGSGQISYFKGVSRFLLTCEECPECAGLGFRLAPDPAEGESHPGRRPQKSPKKMKNAKEKQP